MCFYKVVREPAITGEFIPLFIQTIIVEVTYESSGFCHQVLYFVTDQKPHDITVPVGLLEKTADFFSFSPLILCLPHQLSSFTTPLCSCPPDMGNSIETAIAIDILGTIAIAIAKTNSQLLLLLLVLLRGFPNYCYCY